MIRAVLFDLDGVLVDACDWHYEALNHALKLSCNVVISREDHEKNYNALTTSQKLVKLRDKGVIPAQKVGAVWELKQKYTIETIEKLAKPDQQKIELMQHLKDAQLKVACVTNSVRDSAELMLSRTGILESFDLLITNQDISFPKPHPEGYIRAMITFGSFPEETLIVEDSPKGLESARLTGAHIMHVKNATEVTVESVIKKIEEIDENA